MDRSLITSEHGNPYYHWLVETDHKQSKKWTSKSPIWFQGGCKQIYMTNKQIYIWQKNIYMLWPHSLGGLKNRKHLLHTKYQTYLKGSTFDVKEYRPILLCIANCVMLGTLCLMLICCSLTTWKIRSTLNCTIEKQRKVSWMNEQTVVQRYAVRPHHTITTHNHWFESCSVPPLVSRQLLMHGWINKGLRHGHLSAP